MLTHTNENFNDSQEYVNVKHSSTSATQAIFRVRVLWPILQTFNNRNL